MSFARVHDSRHTYMLWKITTHIGAFTWRRGESGVCVCMQTRRAQLICKVLPGARGPLFMLFYAKITARAHCHAWHTAAHAKLMLLFYAISGDKFNYSPGLRARDSIWPNTLLNLLSYMWKRMWIYIFIICPLPLAYAAVLLIPNPNFKLYMSPEYWWVTFWNLQQNRVCQEMSSHRYDFWDLETKSYLNNFKWGKIIIFFTVFQDISDNVNQGDFAAGNLSFWISDSLVFE
jgi:hypothetical protein